MIGVLLVGAGVLLVGAPLGGAGVWWIFARRLGQALCPDPALHELSDDDREAVAQEFAAHASAVRRKVSEYADLLAGSDAVLRARLRNFEAGEPS